MSSLLWRTVLWTTTTRKTVADHHHVFLYFHSSQQIFRRRLSSTTSSSPFTKRRYPSFEHMVERYKQAAALSFVLEDRSKGAFVWHRPTAEISSRLLGEEFEESPCSVFRWRVGSRDGRQKRFLLIQFASISRLKAAIQGKLLMIFKNLFSIFPFSPRRATQSATVRPNRFLARPAH